MTYCKAALHESYHYVNWSITIINDLLKKGFCMLNTLWFHASLYLHLSATCAPLVLPGCYLSLSLSLPVSLTSLPVSSPRALWLHIVLPLFPICYLCSSCSSWLLRVLLLFFLSAHRAPFVLPSCYLCSSGSSWLFIAFLLFFLVSSLDPLILLLLLSWIVPFHVLLSVS